jgi:cation:H+ antiporter
MTTVLLFAGGIVLLVVAAELFTNAIEWAGFRMRLASGATGSLLAALGTSLPEFVVPVVALAAHSPSADSVAMGAVIGAPFLLLTIGTGITGLAVLTRRGARELVLDKSQPRRDLGVFLVAYPLALIAIALPHAARIAVGVLLLAGYAGYIIATLRSGAPTDEMPEPLHIVRWRNGQPHAVFISVQLVVAIVMLVAGSQLFVDGLNRTADALHIAALVLALVVVPLATELPETLNSVLWVRSRDDALAFGNVAGSATFQSCVLAFIGVVFTTWRPGSTGLISGGLTIATAASLLVLLRNGRARGSRLALAGLPWIGYVVAQVVTGGHLGM